MGVVFFQNNLAWICAVREGYEGMHWFSSEFKNGKWSIAENSDFDPKYEVGELHISNDGNEIYFHSSRAGGKGDLDIWMSKKVNGEWTEPVDIVAVNTERDDGFPALNPSEDELWISRDYGVWRSKKSNGKWKTPEKMFFPLAGEATIDNQRNVYFTHHYFKEDNMVESDIYVAYKK